MGGGGLVNDSRGDLFGVTYNGGANQKGSVFEVAKGSHVVRTLASLSDATGWNPETPIAIDARGDLFGVTVFGGTNGVGTIFEVRKGSRSAVALASFERPSSGPQLVPSDLTSDRRGNLFGIATPSGGGEPVVFELAKGSHTITTLPLGGIAPGNGLTTDARGDLLFTGTAAGDGASGPTNGVYAIPAGTTSVVKVGTIGSADEAGGGLPMGPVFDRSGNLFGTTSGALGVPSDDGSIFELNQGAQNATTRATFHGSDGAQPTVPLVDSRGNVFGVTIEGGTGGYNGNGTVYELAAGSNTVTTLFAFNGADGWAPLSLIADRQGDLFGVTGGGGQFNSGTVFELVKVNSRRR
jgi:uncharacterized repeat protein (TIGR03803 family)